MTTSDASHADGGSTPPDAGVRADAPAPWLADLDPHAVDEAVARLADAADRGATVVIALAGLSVVGIPFLSVMGLAAAGTVAVAGVLLAFGMTYLANRSEVVAGHLDDECVVEYFRGDELVGVCGIGMRGAVQGYRARFTPPVAAR